jgi:hypothetical protein
MNFKGIKQRIEKLAAATEVPVAYQAEQVVRHWRETGDLRFPDRRRVPIAVFRHIIGAAVRPVAAIPLPDAGGASLAALGPEGGHRGRTG